MKPVVIVFSLFMAVCVLFPSSVEAAQQCVSCSSSDCLKSNPQTKSCDRKCFTLLLREDSRDEKPFVIKGCTSDQVFSRRRCDNKCYDKKQEFGSTMHYICVHCCTGDKCNPASQMKGGIILTAVSATLALMKYLYF